MQWASLICTENCIIWHLLQEGFYCLIKCKNENVCEGSTGYCSFQNPCALHIVQANGDIKQFLIKGQFLLGLCVSYLWISQFHLLSWIWYDCYSYQPYRTQGGGKLSKLKSGNLGNGPKWWWPPPSGVGTFFNLGLYWNGLTTPAPHKINLGLFWNGMTPYIFSNQVEYEKYWYKIDQYEW